KSKADGNTNIDGVHKEGQSVADRQAEATKQIDANAQAAKDKIEKDPTLTTDDKNTQKAAVDKAANDAKQNVNNSANADDINKSKADGNTNIDGVHKEGQSVEGRQNDAIKKLQEIFDKTKELINNDVNLIPFYKNKQSNGLDSAFEASKNSINGAENADKIIEALNDAITNVESQYQPKWGIASKEGIEDAINNVSYRDGKYDSIEEKNIYTEARHSYEEGLNGNTSSDNAKNNPFANSVGLSARNGIKDALQNVKNEPENDLQKLAYDNAQKAFDAGLSGDTNSSVASKNNIANKAGLSARNGINDALNGIVNLPTSSDLDKDAYDNAQISYNRGFNNDNTSADALKNPVANNIGLATRYGVDTFANGSVNNPGNPNGTDSEKAIYHGYDSARSGFIYALNYPNKNMEDKNPSKILGFNIGKEVSSGVKDFISGNAKQKNNEHYVRGYNAAKEAIELGKQDAMNNKPNAALANTLSIPNDVDRLSYISVYKGAFDGYKDGQTGRKLTNFDMNYPYNLAYDSIFGSPKKENAVDNNADLPNNFNPNGTNNNTDNGLDNNFVHDNKAIRDFIGKGLDKEDKSDSYIDNYNQIMTGFNEVLKNKVKAPNQSIFYNYGYNMTKDGLLGIKDASNNKVVNLDGKTLGFSLGYKGYKEGFADALKDLSNSNIKSNSPIYNYAYDKGYKDGIKSVVSNATRAGIKDANQNKRIGKFDKYSKVYVNAYKKAYNKQKLNNNYYTKINNNYYYQVISKKGVYIYTSPNFSEKNISKKLSYKDKFTVNKIVNVKGATRFYIGKNQYVTANKKYIKMFK
ncbi:DUF5776 domain-containing protein, partial [Apilactobacillus sp. TMW 2.2459]|uniref:DUF5776 domain-containing protein n=1 Tax=Apilactobacillus xinyiensis TaxID=2841032 RepID=UPI00200BA8BB